MQDTPYFSQRTQPAPLEDRLELTPSFWTAWRHLLKEFGNKDYFCEHMGDECVDGHAYGWSTQATQMRMYREFGEVEWPANEFDAPPEQARIFDFIEFFARFVSKPTSSWHHSYCGNSHPKGYDSEAGRDEYETEVNKLFKGFRHPYRVRNGVVDREISPVLDAPLIGLGLQTNDAHLRTLLEAAIRDFHDRQGSRKLQALQGMVNAFERLKSIQDSDKKRSIAKVIGRLSSDDAVRATINTDMKTLTDIANNFCIRHHERSKQPLNDEHEIEFLFYLFFNFVRLILQKHGMVASVQPEAESDSASEDIPF